MRDRGFFGRIFYVFLPVIVYLAVTIVVTNLFFVIHAFVTGILNGAQEAINSLTTATQDATLLAIPSMISTVILIIVFIKMYRADLNKREYKSNSCKIKLLDVLLIVLLSVPLCISANLLIDFTNIAEYDQTFQRVSEVLYGPNIIIQILSIGILGPICEELLFRNLTIRRMNKYLGKTPTIFLSAIVFAIAHGNMTQGMYAFILGIILAGVFLKYNNVIITIIMHMALNLVSVVWTSTNFLENYSNKPNVIIFIFLLTSLLCVLLMYALNNRKVTAKV